MDPLKIEPKAPIIPDVSQTSVIPDPQASVGGVEAGTTRIEAPISEYVSKSPELQRPDIPSEVAQAGISQGKDNIVIHPSAIASGVAPANPQISQFKGVTLPTPIEQARKTAKTGNPNSGDTGIANIEVMQVDRATLSDREDLPEAA